MVIQYSPSPSELTPYIIPDEVMLGIGRLVRACAEIEDIISLFLSSVAEVSEGQLLLLLGRTQLSKKLELAASFASAKGGEAAAAYATCFENEAFKAIIRGRNVAAHGVFLGATNEGQLAFRTTAVSRASAETVDVEVQCFTHTHFMQIASIAEQAIPDLEQILRTQPLREQRRTQALHPHRKAQPTRAPSAKPTRQRRSPKASKRSDK